MIENNNTYQNTFSTSVGAPKTLDSVGGGVAYKLFSNLFLVNQSLNGHNQLLSTPLQSLNTPNQSLSTPLQSLSMPNQSLSMPNQSLNGHIQSLNTPNQSLNGHKIELSDNLKY